MPDVNTTFFASIAATGFAVAFLHAALPTHWLPFVLVGRAQKWSTGRTLGVTLLAGLGHVGLTILLGLAWWPRVWWSRSWAAYFHWIVGGLMVADRRLLSSARTPQPRAAGSRPASLRLRPGGDHRPGGAADPVAVRGLPALLPGRHAARLVGFSP
jgi:hypothetical protein